MSAKCRDAINVPVPVEITTTNITRDVRTGEEISSRPGNRRTVWVEARMSPIYSAKFDQYQRIIDGIGGRTVVQGIQDLFSPGEPRAGEVYAAGLASREDMLWLIDQVGCDQAVLDQLGENLRRYGLGLPSLQDETGQATGSASVLTWFKVDQSRSVLGLLIDGFATPENQDASYFEDTLRAEVGSDIFSTNFGSFSRRNLFVTSAQTAPNGLKEMRLHRISNEYTNIMLPDALHVGKSNADETFRRFYIPLPYEPTILECIYADGTVTRQWYELGEWLEEQPEGFLSRFDFPASHPLAKILVRTGQSEQGIHMSNVCS